MKKILSVLIIILFLIPLSAGCRADTTAETETPQSEVVNPIEEYESISKLNAALGFDMIELNSEFGYVPYEYDTIAKTLGQIEYTDTPPEPTEEEEASLLPTQTETPVSERHITLRMAQGDEDITGISGVEYAAEDFNGLDVNIGVYENTVYIGWWVYEDYCYSLAAYNIDANTADAMINSLTAEVLGIEPETENG